MNNMHGAFVLVCLLAAPGILPVAAADLEQECRQEAEEYGISGEQVEDYVSGCIASRGGYAMETDVEAYIPPPEEYGAGWQEDAGEQSGETAEDLAHEPQ
jgi:hypothetical protein